MKSIGADKSNAILIAFRYLYGLPSEGAYRERIDEFLSESGIE